MRWRATTGCFVIVDGHEPAWSNETSAARWHRDQSPNRRAHTRKTRYEREVLSVSERRR
jgi:hypothetical protein